MKKIIFLACLLAIISTAQLYSQWNYGTAISNSPSSSTWVHVQNRPPLNEMFDSLTFPYPTNAWFNNLFLGQQTYPAPLGQLGANKIHPYPYQISLGTGYTAYSNYKALLTINYRPFDVTLSGDSLPTISWNTANFLYIGTSEPANIKPSLLNDYTELSATIKFVNSANTSKYYYAPIVRGMPYVTMFYNNTKPGIFFPSPAILRINDITVSNGMNFTNTVFKIETTGINNTPNRPQTWMLYSSVPITLQISTNAATQGLIAPADFTGWLRLAHVTYQGENITPQQVNDKINLLTAYSRFIPVKGQVTASYSTGNSASVHYNFTRYNEGSFGSNDSLLMMALPHHTDMLSNPVTDILKYSVLKGNMKEVHQKTWNMTENMMPEYSFYPKNGKLSDVPLQWCDTLQHYLNIDFQTYFTRNSLGTDLYGIGKNFQRLARVVVIADELYERDNARYASVLGLASQMRDSLKLFLGHYLDGGHTVNPYIPSNVWDSVFYDTKYGGLISSMSWDSLNINCCVSYGSALYNDHHFHYGYAIYAAAAIAKKNPEWFTANGNHYLNRVTDLIRDIANPSRSDGQFALMRYKDWYEGHSWANGMVPFGDGKNQESSSEAINAWYGMYLFGLAAGNENIKNTGALMLAQEIRATKKYYNITLPQTNPVYPSFYTDKYHIAGNIYQTKFDANTFFSTASYAIHGIHVIPLTPVTEQLWDYNFAKDIFDYSPNGLSYSPCFNPNNISTLIWNWTTINVGIQAVAYPNEALSFFPRYGYLSSNYDNGTSSSNVMYWILTRKYNPIGINIIGTEVPQKYSLEQNYPNPFNPITFIKFSIPEKSFVKLLLYDVLGRETAVLIQKELTPGSYNYELNAGSLSSGVYFYTLLADGNKIGSKKMVLVK
jgi:endo-1,3(4)-beta-glucanase